MKLHEQGREGALAVAGEVGECLRVLRVGAGGPTSVSAAAAEVRAGVVRADVLADNTPADLQLPDRASPALPSRPTAPAAAWDPLLGARASCPRRTGSRGQISMRSNSEISARSGVNKRKDENVVLYLVEQHPIILDMAVAKTGEITGKRMVPVLGRQRLTRCENAHDIHDFGDVLPALEHPFEALFVARGFADTVFHDSMNSSSLSGSVQVGALGSFSTSSASLSAARRRSCLL